MMNHWPVKINDVKDLSQLLNHWKLQREEVVIVNQYVIDPDPEYGLGNPRLERLVFPVLDVLDNPTYLYRIKDSEDRKNVMWCFLQVEPRLPGLINFRRFFWRTFLKMKPKYPPYNKDRSIDGVLDDIWLYAGRLKEAAHAYLSRNKRVMTRTEPDHNIEGNPESSYNIPCPQFDQPENDDLQGSLSSVDFGPHGIIGGVETAQAKCPIPMPMVTSPPRSKQKVQRSPIPMPMVTCPPSESYARIGATWDSPLESPDPFMQSWDSFEQPFDAFLT